MIQIIRVIWVIEVIWVIWVIWVIGVFWIASIGHFGLVVCFVDIFSLIQFSDQAAKTSKTLNFLGNLKLSALKQCFH